MTSTNGLWNPTDVYRRVLDNDWPGSDEDASGLVLLRPESVSYNAGYATISNSGSIDCISASQVQVNGVFTSAYRNYMVVWNTRDLSTNPSYVWRFSSGGTPATLAYKYREFTVDGLTEFSTSGSTSIVNVGRAYNRTSYSGAALTTFIYDPAVASPTSWISRSVYRYNIVYSWMRYGTQDDSTAFDGIYFYSTVGTGRISIYGLEGN